MRNYWRRLQRSWEFRQKNFDEEKAIFAIQNNYDNSRAHSNFQYQPNFNPLDKYVEAVEDFKRLNEDNKKLYMALLKEKDEKIALSERMFEKEQKVSLFELM
jgi:hypothetical protein